MEYVKIYLSTNFIETQDKIASFSYAEVGKRIKIQEERDACGFQDEIMHVKPIDFIPEEVEFYRDLKQVVVTSGKLKKHVRELAPNILKDDVTE